MAYLNRRIEGMGLLVAATRRDAERGTDPALLAEITGDPSATSLRPQPLSPTAGRELVSAGLGREPDERFTAACQKATGGNPLLLGQLVSALRSDGVEPDASQVERVLDVGPRAVSRTVLMRLARLAPDTVQVARAVAVLGAAADLPTVAAQTGLEAEAVAEATTALARAEILGAESPLGFVHPLVRDAVYQELSPGERELDHERAARLLAEAGAAPERVATHLLVLPPRADEWAARVLHDAGRSALAKGAVDSAVAYLRRALEEPPSPGQRTTIQFELGAAEALTNGPAAAEHLTAAYVDLRDPAARGVAANILGRTLLFTGAAEEGRRWPARRPSGCRPRWATCARRWRRSRWPAWSSAAATASSTGGWRPTARCRARRRAWVSGRWPPWRRCSGCTPAAPPRTAPRWRWPRWRAAA